jgi:RecA-family ATPase
MRQVTLLSGDGGVGKSLLALQLAAAAAMSVETLDLVPWAGRVIYVGAEDEAEEFQRRLFDISKAHGLAMDDLLLMRLVPLADRDALLAVPDRAKVMQPTPLWRGIVNYAHEQQPKLIVLDTSADLFAGDENDRGQVRQFIAMLRKLAIEIDCAIILLSHPSVKGMEAGSGISGSTGWNNSVRSRLYLTRDKDDPDLRIMKVMKSNYGTMGDEIKIRWRAGAFVLDDGSTPAGAALVEGKYDQVFIETLEKFTATGQRLSPRPSATYAPKMISEHPNAKGFRKGELSKAMQRLLEKGAIKIVEDGPQSRRTTFLELAA